MNKEERTAIEIAKRVFKNPADFGVICRNTEEENKGIVKFIDAMFNFDNDGRCIGFNDNVVSGFNSISPMIDLGSISE